MSPFFNAEVTGTHGHVQLFTWILVFQRQLLTLVQQVLLASDPLPSLTFNP